MDRSRKRKAGAAASLEDEGSAAKRTKLPVRANILLSIHQILQREQMSQTKFDDRRAKKGGFVWWWW